MISCFLRALQRFTSVRSLGLAGLIFLQFLSQGLEALNIQNGYVPAFIDPQPKELRVTPQPAVISRSIILVESTTGTILYQKDIDEPIPPASLTKLVVMALAFQHLSLTNTALDSPVTISPRAWAANMPARSSLMFLGPNQDATWNDLLLGLAVDSGNDAAVAIAENVDGSVEAFVDHMNRYCHELGLTSTTFVEPSGYDEHSMTTARDFAYFVWHYLDTWPQVLAQFHSVLSFTWPRQFGQKQITQQNTNKLLTTYQGADGLKTGYIDESGYNLAFTAQRDGMRLMGVILGSESDQIRIQEARDIMDYGFSQYRLLTLSLAETTPIRVWRGSQSQIKLPDGQVQAILPLSMIPDLKRGMNQLREIEAPVSTRRVLAWTEFFTSSGQKVLRFPMRSPNIVAQADPLTSSADAAYLWIRSLFGAGWPESGSDADIP